MISMQPRATRPTRAPRYHVSVSGSVYDRLASAATRRATSIPRLIEQAFGLDPAPPSPGRLRRCQRRALGVAIATWRRSVGLTQSGLAGRLGVTIRAISGWESGWSTPQARYMAALRQLGFEPPPLTTEGAA